MPHSGLIAFLMLDYLFVYGTLRKAKDGSVHPDLTPSLLINTASVPGKLYQVDRYPGMVLDFAHDHHHVQGEVYQLLQAEQQLKTLDDYEECSDSFPEPHEYQRVQTIATLADSNPITVWVYVFRHSTEELEQIVSGDYFAYLPLSHLS